MIYILCNLGLLFRKLFIYVKYLIFTIYLQKGIFTYFRTDHKQIVKIIINIIEKIIL